MVRDRKSTRSLFHVHSAEASRSASNAKRKKASAPSTLGTELPCEFMSWLCGTSQARCHKTSPSQARSKHLEITHPRQDRKKEKDRSRSAAPGRAIRDTRNCSWFFWRINSGSIVQIHSFQQGRSRALSAVAAFALHRFGRCLGDRVCQSRGEIASHFL